jgi:hypothetical protein
MQENREPSTHSQCMDRPRTSPHRSRSHWRFGGDRATTILAICVSLVIGLAGALAYLILVGLVLVLTGGLAHSWLHVPT